MIYLIMLLLVFVFSAVSLKLCMRKNELLEERVYSLEETLKIMGTTTTETVANGEAVEANINGGSNHE